MNTRLLVASFVISISSILYAQAADPINTTDSSHPFVKMLEAQYDTYLDAARKGDVEAYKRTRTVDVVTFMEEHLKKQNKLNDFGSMIQEMTAYDPSYRDFQFIACDTAEGIARLAYMRDSEIRDASNKPRLEFLFLMFHREAGSWRIGYIGNAYLPAIHDDGTDASIRDFDDHGKFGLPSRLGKEDVLHN